jgi:hypothetical protein
MLQATRSARNSGRSGSAVRGPGSGVRKIVNARPTVARLAPASLRSVDPWRYGARLAAESGQHDGR